VKFTATHVVALVLGLAVVIGFDRWSGRTDRWKQAVVDAAEQARIKDSAQGATDSLHRIRDSVFQDSILAEARSDEATRIRLGQENGRLRVLLARAPTMPDTVDAQARIIVQQDSIIASDSAQKVRLRAVIASKDTSIVNLSSSLADARRRLADLIGVAQRPPKEFKLLGFTLSLKPYIGIGANVSPAGKVSTGLQLGLSILRG
jgi:hypothetical protein